MKFISNQIVFFFSPFITVECENHSDQMSHAYNDIEAVTLLLEEKEKDLELAVHIGQELLTENTQLKKQVERMGNEIKEKNESCQQLQYNLAAKCSLLAELTNDDESVEYEKKEGKLIFRLFPSQQRNSRKFLFTFKMSALNFTSIESS